MAKKQSKTAPSAELVPLDPQALIEKAMEQGEVEQLERVVALYKDMRAEVARDAWNTAMAQFQDQCPPIKKTKEADIRTKSGAQFEYRYAPLDGVLKIVQPIMAPLGLSISWRQQTESEKVGATCRISHEKGHYEESGWMFIPIPTGSIGASEPQRHGIAMTYARRYTLMSILGIAPEEDTDAQTPLEEPIEEPRRTSEKEQKKPKKKRKRKRSQKQLNKDYLAKCVLFEEKLGEHFFKSCLDELKIDQPKSLFGDLTRQTQFIELLTEVDKYRNDPSPPSELVIIISRGYEYEEDAVAEDESKQEEEADVEAQKDQDIKDIFGE